jgi:hypothetical protein
MGRVVGKSFVGTKGGCLMLLWVLEVVVAGSLDLYCRLGLGIDG